MVCIEHPLKTGRWVNMSCNINGIEISNEELNKYYDKLINKIFAILGVYEDCEKESNFDNYTIYIDRVLTELIGGYYLMDSEAFLSLYNILLGIKSSNDNNHKKIKSIVFHCISVVKKMKV